MAHTRDGEARNQFWKRLIVGAAHEAKRTHCGLPTGNALIQLWWLAEHRPSRTDKAEWERSFECACEQLGRDPAKLREKLVRQIEAAWRRDNEQVMQSEIYIRRAQVLACAGIPTTIARQYLLPLVDEGSYEDVAGIERCGDGVDSGGVRQSTTGVPANMEGKRYSQNFSPRG